MERSHDEVRRVLGHLNREDVPTLRGSRAWMSNGRAVPSEARDDLVERARNSSGVLYVVAIGAITNVASALLVAPDIAEKIVVTWLGGNPSRWHRAAEFNVFQDMEAARVVFDSGVPLVHVPCVNVAEHLRLSAAEVEKFVAGRGPVGDYLAQIFARATGGAPMCSRVIWDIAPFAWLVNPDWAPSALVHSPILASEDCWGHDPRRHLVREVLGLDRDAIIKDLLEKLEAHGATGAQQVL